MTEEDWIEIYEYRWETKTISQELKNFANFLGVVGLILFISAFVYLFSTKVFPIPNEFWIVCIFSWSFITIAAYIEDRSKINLLLAKFPNKSDKVRE